MRYKIIFWFTVAFEGALKVQPLEIHVSATWGHYSKYGEQRRALVFVFLFCWLLPLLGKKTILILLKPAASKCDNAFFLFGVHQLSTTQQSINTWCHLRGPCVVSLQAVLYSVEADTDRSLRATANQLLLLSCCRNTQFTVIDFTKSVMFTLRICWFYLKPFFLVPLKHLLYIWKQHSPPPCLTLELFSN